MLQLEQQLDQLARSMGKSRSACVREAIAQYVQRFSTTDEAQRQSALIAAAGDSANWSWDYPDSVDRRHLSWQRGGMGPSCPAGRNPSCMTATDAWALKVNANRLP